MRRDGALGRHRPAAWRLLRSLGSYGRRLVALSLLVGAGAVQAQEPPPPATSQEAPAPLGAPAAWATAAPRTLALPADSVLRAEPSPLSQALLRLDADREVEVLEERGSWVRVALDEVRGWVSAAGPELPPASPAAALSPVVSLDQARLQLRDVRLERARALLVDARTEGLGKIEWWTDLHPSSRLSERLSRLIACFDESYVERYGLDLVYYEEPDAVVTFVRQEDYRRFTETEAEVVELVSGGFSSIGFAAVFTGARQADDVAAIVAHELTHLANRRRLAFEIPPWLEEGLAEDMAVAAAASGRCPQAGGWPAISRRAWNIGSSKAEELLVLETMSGKLRGLACTLDSWHRSSPDLRELTTLDWGQFSRPQGRATRYATSALLVRFLLDGAVATENRDAFRAFLRAGRDTARFELDDLLDRLGVDDERLAESLMHWAHGELGALPCG